MNRIKPNRIIYYILLSILIHLIIFLIDKEDKDLTQGEKIIPIEVVDNLFKSGIGEATKRSKGLIKKYSLKEKSKEEKKKKKNPSDLVKSFEDKKLNEDIKEEKDKQDQEKTNTINQNILKEEQGSGSREGIKNNEPEKGSLKGLGKIKITCLKCIRPDYPPIALRRGAEGTPIIKVWINKDGSVKKAEFISISGIKSIDQAAKKAAINSTFYPIDKESSINIEYDLKIK